MRKQQMGIFIIVFMLLAPFLAEAQPPGKDEYDVYETVDPLAQFYGSKLPGYYVTKDGQRTDCLILFETGDKMNSFDSKLNTSMSHAGESKMIDKSSLAAFLVNNRLYASAVVDDTLKWVKLETQGAIRVVKHAFYSEYHANKKLEFWWDEVKKVNVGYWDTTSVSMPRWNEVERFQKLDNPTKDVLMFSRKKMVKWVIEDEDLASKIENKEAGYKSSLTDFGYRDRMFGIYNKWYDEQNPGKIIYYDTVATFVAPDMPVAKAAVVAAAVVEEKPVEKTYEEKVIEASKEANLAPRIDPFKGRPTTASAAVASAKPEVTVKKESFKERLARIKADGNKVGVLVTSSNLVINPNDVGEGITKARVLGTYGPLEGLDKLADATTSALNDGFGIDVFETVDYAQIPVKNGKYGKMDDWWSTKYKIILIYEIEPMYLAYYKTNAESSEKEYIANMRVVGEVIFMSAEEVKPDKLRYVTSSSKTWSYFNSEKFIGPAETDFHIIQDLKGAINPPSDEEVIEALISNQELAVAKFIKKKSK